MQILGGRPMVAPTVLFDRLLDKWEFEQLWVILRSSQGILRLRLRMTARIILHFAFCTHFRRNAEGGVPYGVILYFGLILAHSY